MKSFSKWMLGLGMLLAMAEPASAIEVVSPHSEATVHDNAGNVAVTVDPGPQGLAQGRRIRVLLDGAPAAPEAASRLFQLEGVDRGRHGLRAELLDAQGRRVAISDEVVFNMWRASKNFPARKP